MLSFLAKQKKRNEISADELQQHLAGGGKPRIIDVREPWEHEEGHIPGCTLRPLGEIQNWAGELNKEDEVVLVCRSGNRSGSAYEYLEKQGFTKLKNLSGGMIGWKGPVER
ncbi:MAG TPA: rhodanese-like domain-containing protein [Symbiobacteriaceae bacterium]|nr:rhodanese-like domain-containing protein [Symbiobacteriaceae bacterium]